MSLLFPGFFSAVVLALLFIVTYFYLTDLTLHSGYQIFKQVEDYDDGIVSKMDPSSPKSMLSMKDLIKNMDCMLVVFTNGFFFYISVTIELNAMIMSIDKFHWTMVKLSVVVLITTSLSLVLVLIGGTKMYNDIYSTYMIFVLDFLVVWIILLVLMLPALFPEMFEYDVKSQYLLFGITIFFRFYVGISAQTCGRSLVFYLVPDHSASFAEGFRIGTVRIFLFLGFLFADFLYDNSVLIYVFPIFCCALFFCAVLLLSRRKIYL